MTTTDKPKGRKKSEPVIPVLTAPVSAKSKGVAKVTLDGHEEAAARIRVLKREIDGLEAESSLLEAELVSAAKAARRESEIAGRFAKTVAVSSSDGQPVDVTFGDRYRRVPVANEEVLREALGKQYPACFHREVAVKVRGHLTLEALQEALGDRFEAFAALVDVEESLIVAEGFMSTRAALRPTLSAKLNTVLDGIVEQVQIAPSIKTK